MSRMPSRKKDLVFEPILRVLSGSAVRILFWTSMMKNDL
jgi:hypothetical protein